jgi:hypothetical protein
MRLVTYSERRAGCSEKKGGKAHRNGQAHETCLLGAKLEHPRYIGMYHML